MFFDLVVTRHQSLVDYMMEIGLISGQEQIVSHVRPQDIEGKDVVGVLPLAIAKHANTVTEVPLQMTKQDRGKDLDIKRVREIAETPICYRIQSQRLDLPLWKN